VFLGLALALNTVYENTAALFIPKIDESFCIIKTFFSQRKKRKNITKIKKESTDGRHICQMNVANRRLIMLNMRNHAIRGLEHKAIFGRNQFCIIVS